MTDYPEPLLAHLSQELTTVCHCWRLTRADGVAAGFTDHDMPLLIDGLAYEPQSGFSASEARDSLGLAIDTVDIEGAIDSAGLREEDIAAGLYDGAAVETLLVNWRDPATYAVIRRAAIGSITRSDGRFVAELDSDSRRLDAANGRFVRRGCDAELGDGRCGVDLDQAGFRGTGTVTAFAAPLTLAVAGLDGFAAAWFSHGLLTWTGGANAGRTALIAAHGADEGGVRLVLRDPPTAEPAPGDAFAVVAGCDKRFSTCRQKFANSINFRGFPHLPGNDAAYGYVAEGGLFDGGPLVP